MKNSIFSRLLVSILCVSIAGLIPTSAWADEGFSPYSQVPVEQIATEYGVHLTPAWLEHLQKSTVRFHFPQTESVRSGSFVSGDGVVLTNWHVMGYALARLKTPNRDVQEQGFVALRREDELNRSSDPQHSDERRGCDGSRALCRSCQYLGQDSGAGAKRRDPKCMASPHLCTN